MVYSENINFKFEALYVNLKWHILAPAATFTFVSLEF